MTADNIAAKPSAGGSASTGGARPRVHVDPSRCQTCGRDPAGLRCSVPATLSYSRSLARARTAGGEPPVGGQATSAQTWQTRAPSTEPQYSCPSVAPCNRACPLSLCVEGYVNHVAAGEHFEARSHILERTALPESVCRVCDRPCEAVCARQRPVAINALKRFAISQALLEAGSEEGALEFPEAEEKHGHRVAVVGAGPSGLAAAHELLLRGYDVTLFDAAPRAGGLLAHGIPAYRLPSAPLERDIARVLDSGVEFIGGKALGRDVTVAGLLADGRDAVYLAIGAHRSKALELPGAGDELAPVVQGALEFLGTLRHGEKPKLFGRVVVIGGGDAAVDAARSALRLGADSVTIVCIESRARMPAFADQIAQAEAEGVELRTQYKPLRLEAGLLVCGAVAGEGELRLPASRVITAIGQEPELRCLEGDVELERTGAGELVVDGETGRTSLARVYAGGDLVPGARTVTAAMASGLRAAAAIDVEIRGELASDRTPPPRIPGAGALEPGRKLPLAGPGGGPRPEVVSEPQRRPEDFREVTATLTESAARAEASRCMACGLCGNCRACIDLFGCPALVEKDGCVVVDRGLCNGCGACIDFCPNGAIRVEEPA